MKTFIKPSKNKIVILTIEFEMDYEKYDNKKGTDMKLSMCVQENQKGVNIIEK
jgi:hypothetical protein